MPVAPRRGIKFSPLADPNRGAARAVELRAAAPASLRGAIGPRGGICRSSGRGKARGNTALPRIVAPLSSALGAATVKALPSSYRGELMAVIPRVEPDATLCPSSSDTLKVLTLKMLKWGRPRGGTTTACGALPRSQRCVTADGKSVDGGGAATDAAFDGAVRGRAGSGAGSVGRCVDGALRTEDASSEILNPAKSFTRSESASALGLCWFVSTRYT